MFNQLSVRKFNPSANFETYAYSRLNQLPEVASNKTRAFAELEKLGIGYRLKLHIISPEGTSSHESLANDAKTAIDRLVKRFHALSAAI